MNEDCIILVDDKPDFEVQFREQFSQFKIKSKLVYFKNSEELNDGLKKIDIDSIKFLIFDLCTEPSETNLKIYKIQPDIERFYKFNRIIIFIHSAFIDNFELYPNEGTLFKFEKDTKSIKNICERIYTLEESNFQNLFSKGGIIEKNYMDQIHSAFRSQFKGDEIIQIIESIKSANTLTLKERVEEVFSRIAVKCLIHNLYNSTLIQSETNTIEDVNINAIENYYNRTSNYKVWTGDIFKFKNGDEYVVVLNPRCNFSNDKIHHILFCLINELDDTVITPFLKEDNLRKGLTDNVTLLPISDRFRFLPKTPKFIGGLIDFNTLMSLPSEVFVEKYSLITSISDDLTNDVIRKCSSYLVRGGVYVNETKEALYYLKNDNGRKP